MKRAHFRPFLSTVKGLERRVGKMWKEGEVKPGAEKEKR